MNKPRKPTAPIDIGAAKKEPKPLGTGEFFCGLGCVALVLLFVILFAIGVFRHLIHFAFGW